MDEKLEKAAKELTGVGLSEWGGVGKLAEYLGVNYRDIERLKHGKHPNKWLVKYIKVKAALGPIYKESENERND